VSSGSQQKAQSKDEKKQDKGAQDKAKASDVKK
jgi:hypothetical protein